MPQERDNPYPRVTPEEIAAAPGSRELKAARNIAVRKFGGIPVRGFLVGTNDGSPMLQGISELTDLCYRILDEFAEDSNAYPLLLELRDMLTDDGITPVVAGGLL